MFVWHKTKFFHLKILDTKTMNNVTTIFKRRHHYYIQVFEVFVFKRANLRLDQRHNLDSKKHGGPISFTIYYLYATKLNFS